MALGTAQFGLTYGVANRSGQVSREEAAKILAHAREAGMDTLDTAIAYGQSEQRLGDIGVASWHVVSKLPALPAECTDVAGWVRASVTDSLGRLRIERLRALLLHRPADLLERRGDDLHDALMELKAGGLVEKVGVSIYDPAELEGLVKRYPMDIVQSPFNIFDRTLATSGWLARLHAGATEVHARSAFLQGALLLAAGDRPAFFARWAGLFARWDRWLAEQHLTPLQASLGFVRSHAFVDRIVVGVDRLDQLAGILDALDATVPAPPAELVSHDPDLINPSRWILA